ncbi:MULTISPECIES: restriction endonuclease subunit S [Bacteroidales]|nr:MULTISPECIES: restriction endonuclease subunit S [Bacteroidales]
MRFPKFSGEWKREILNDVCTFHNGRAYKQNELLSDGKYRVLRVGNFFTNDSWYYSDLELDDEKVAVNGDLLYAWSASFGPRFWTGEKVIYHYHIWKIDSFQQVSKEFLFYFLERDTEKIKNEVQGGTMVHITKGDMEKREILYPSILEQSKIARLLSLLDERIATQNKIIEKLQSLIKGIVDELMTVLLKGKLYPFSSFYIKAGEGGTPTTSVNEYYLGGTIPFIKIEDLSCKYLTSNKDFITELGMQKSSAWLIPSHSVIYSNGATIGAISINEYPICTKQGILGIVPNTNINVEYLYLLMSSSYFSKEVNRIVTEGTMKTAYLKDINHIKCPLPSMAQQQNITNLTSSIEKKLFVEQELLKLLNIQKQHLLRTMFI